LNLVTSFVLGYHGCDQSVAEALLGGDEFKHETNEWDWLGSGAYFWEANPLRGLEYAHELKATPKKTKGTVDNPAVVGAIIDLGVCLDLTSSNGIRAVAASHKSFLQLCKASGRDVPQNRGGADRLMRNLDCAVINHLHQVRETTNPPLLPFDTVRGVFLEGDDIYEGAGFKVKTHIQICVRNLECIKGVFRVPKRYLADFKAPAIKLRHTRTPRP
jgi:hypothetical protein